MGAGVQQAHGLVLAVHLQQEGAQFPQQGDAHGLIIDEGAGAAVGAEGPAQDEILISRRV